MDVEIRKGINKARRLINQRKFVEADKITRELHQAGMSVQDFHANTSVSERRAMKAWVQQGKPRGVSEIDGLNNPRYTHYVVVWKGDKPKGSKPAKNARIESGWESSADAKERHTEIVDVESEGEGLFQDAHAAVVSKAIIKSLWRLDPKDDSAWFKPGEGLTGRGLAPTLRDTPTEGERADFDEFFDSYIETALWSTNDESDESGGNPLDDNYGESDFDEKDLQKLRDEAWEFFETHQSDIDNGWPKGLGAFKQAGHDFWLTRNRHGAGFWDGEWRKPYDDQLTKASETYGSIDIYVGDDGKLYTSE